MVFFQRNILIQNVKIFTVVFVDIVGVTVVVEVVTVVIVLVFVVVVVVVVVVVDDERSSFSWFFIKDLIRIKKFLFFQNILILSYGFG